MKKIIHKNLFSDKWNKMPLSLQFANIGSEFNRTLHWHEEKNEENEKKAFDRLLELIDLTISDKRWQNRVFEIVRLREVICDFFIGKNIYNSSSKIFKNYFLFFAKLKI